MTHTNATLAPTRGIPLHAYLREHAATSPDKTAIVFYGREFSYRWLDESSDSLAAQLAARGVEKGDTVAVFMQNCPQFLVSFFAAQKLGAVVGPCNPMFKKWELEYQLTDLGAKVLITTDDLASVVEATAGSTPVEHLISSSNEEALPAGGSASFPGPLGVAPAAGAERFFDLIAAGIRAPEEPPIEMETDPALVIYTSGTTGQPKGAQLSFRNAEFKTACMLSTYGFRSDDVFLSVMPVFHIAGMLVGVNSPIMAGATIVLLNRFDADEVLRAMQAHRVSVMYSTPPMHAQLMASPLFARESFPAFRMNLGTSFGTQIDEALSDSWAAQSGVPLFEFAYGMSETHTGDTLMPPQAIRYGSVGKPTCETSVRICDPNDRSIDVPPGELGEVAIKSPSVFLGYRGRQEATDAVKVDGWYYSGDMGRVDEDGYLFFDGRSKEMIKSNGYSVFPEEVERMLVRHAAIRQAAVVGFDDGARGQSARAFLVLENEAVGTVTEAEIIGWARERMAAYKYPRSVRFIDEIPQTSTGKMLRMKLKELD